MKNGSESRMPWGLTRREDFHDKTFLNFCQHAKMLTQTNHQVIRNVLNKN